MCSQSENLSPEIGVLKGPNIINNRLVMNIFKKPQYVALNLSLSLK